MKESAKLMMILLQQSSLIPFQLLLMLLNQCSNNTPLVSYLELHVELLLITLLLLLVTTTLIQHPISLLETHGAYHGANQVTSISLKVQQVPLLEPVQSTQMFTIHMLKQHELIKVKMINLILYIKIS